MDDDYELDLLADIEITFDKNTSQDSAKRTRLIKQLCALKGLNLPQRPGCKGNTHNDRIAFMDENYPTWRGYEVS